MAQFKRSRVIMFGAFALSGALAISGMNLLALLFGWVAVWQPHIEREVRNGSHQYPGGEACI